MKNNKILYYALITTFTLLYLLIAFVSTIHAVSFFRLANIGSLAILLGVAYEVGQSTILFSIILTENKNKLLAWCMMFLLTALQISANVYASFKFIDLSGTNDWTYWQRSILFSIHAESPEMYKIIISWISGALLPIVALGMTALVANNIQLANKIKKDTQETDTGETNETIVEENKQSNDIDKELNQYLSESLDENKLPEVNIKTTSKTVDAKPRIFTKRKNGKFEPAPSNRIKGWHIMKEFVDEEHNVFNKGKFVNNDPTKVPTSKKA